DGRLPAAVPVSGLPQSAAGVCPVACASVAAGVAGSAASPLMTPREVPPAWATEILRGFAPAAAGSGRGGTRAAGWGAVRGVGGGRRRGGPAAAGGRRCRWGARG